MDVQQAVLNPETPVMAVVTGVHPAAVFVVLQAKSIMRGYDDETGEGPPAVGASERLQTVQDRWDCESVLSLRSNLDNHPASIAEPSSRRRLRRQVPFIVLADAEMQPSSKLVHCSSLRLSSSAISSTAPATIPLRQCDGCTLRQCDGCTSFLGFKSATGIL